MLLVQVRQYAANKRERWEECGVGLTDFRFLSLEMRDRVRRDLVLA